MIYHVLDESEPFSELKGGAIQRIVANLMLADPNCSVVTVSADGSWTFSPDRVVQIPLLYGRTRWRGMPHYPSLVQRRLLHGWHSSLAAVLKRGDVLWIHNRPDVVEELAPMAQPMGVKLVLHMHNSISPYRRNSSYFKTFSAADKVVFVSDFLERETRDRFKYLGHTVVMHNGADEKIFYPAPSLPERETPVVTFVGRIIATKGADVLTGAMTILQSQGVKLHARFIGASFFGGTVAPYMKRLRDRAPSNVSFEGYRTGTGLADEYRDSDMFCCPSVWNDPFPTVNLEAMGCGLPCVGTKAGGIPEQFAEGGGILVDRGNSEQLAAALKRLAESRDLREELREQSIRNFKQNFTWGKAAQRFKAIAGQV